jgi:hypothetical protein
MTAVNNLFANDLPYSQATGNIILTHDQHMILYPGQKYCRAVPPVKLAYTAYTLSFKGPFFQCLGRNISSALKRNARLNKSILIVAQETIRLLDMIGKPILCRIGEEKYCGVLEAIEPAYAHVVFLIIRGAAREGQWRVELKISQLADDSAECEIMEDEQGMHEDADCVLVEKPH